MDSRKFSTNFEDLDQLPQDVRKELLAQSRRAATADLGLGQQFVVLMLTTLLLGFSVAVAPMLIWSLPPLQAVPFVGLGAILALFVYRKSETRILQKGYEELQRRELAE